MTSKRFKKLLMGGKVAFFNFDGICYDLMLSRDMAEYFVKAVKKKQGKASYTGAYKYISNTCVNM